ncbi:uncharacterized protein LOC133923605 [Phragmites australis]|uniref:uncharacterized protein LOC133923605 n=1 Tax=Phragmites australis TaxID=29695 RepID=UPI002D797A98|nr:uncharacterized protein LOC133923605 [Phragmites australis]
MASLVGAPEGVLTLDEADDGRCLDIFALCGVSIKKAGSSSAPTASREACLAYHAVGLFALTLRKGGATEILDQSFLILSRTLRLAASTDALVVVAALDCIAVVTFAGALVTEQAEPERSLKAIWDVIFPSRSSGSPKTKSTQLVAAAVSACTFLITTVTVTDAQRKADRAAWNATIASLAGLLEANDRTIRMTVGEALAVCVELNLTQHTSRKDMEALRQSRQINNKRRDKEMRIDRDMAWEAKNASEQRLGCYRSLVDTKMKCLITKLLLAYRNCD